MKITSGIMLAITLMAVIAAVFSTFTVEAKSLRIPPQTICTSNAQCASSQFCEFSQGACGGVGNCVAIPAFCPTIYDPVCGCNGVTYSNNCFRAMAAVPLNYPGVC